MKALDAPDTPHHEHLDEIVGVSDDAPHDPVAHAEDDGGVAGWIIAYVQAWKERLDIDHWRVGIQVLTVVNKNPDCLGLCECEPLLRQAMVSLRSDIEETGPWKRVIIHELVHVWMNPIDQAVQQIIDQLPKPVRKLAHRIFRAAKEPLVETLARTLYRLALPIDEPAPPAARGRRKAQ